MRTRSPESVTRTHTRNAAEILQRQNNEDNTPDAGRDNSGGDAGAAPDPANLERIRREAYDQGVVDERHRRNEAVDAALRQLLDQASAIAENVREVRERVEVDGDRLVRSVLRAVVPEISRRAAGQELIDTINEAIRETRPASEVQIILHPRVATVITDRIDRENAPVGVGIHTDPGLAPREAQLAWRGGGTDLDLGSVLDRTMRILDGLPNLDQANATNHDPAPDTADSPSTNACGDAADTDQTSENATSAETTKQEGNGDG